MAEPYFPTPTEKKPVPPAVPYRAPSAPVLPVAATAAVKRASASAPVTADEESQSPVRDFFAELFTRLLVRVAAIVLTLGIVYGLVTLGQAYGDRIPGAWTGFALMAFVVIGLPLVLVLRMRRLWQRLTR